VDTRAQLTYTGLTGVAAIELFGSTAGGTLLVNIDSSATPRIESIPSTLGELMRNGGGVMERAQVLINKASDMLSEENIEHVSATLAHLDQLSAQINNDYPEFSELLQRTKTLESQLTKASQRADMVLAQLSQELSRDAGNPDNLRAQSASALLEIRNAAQALSKASQASVNTFAKADQALIEEFASTLQTIRSLSMNLQQITERFDQAPAAYLLGEQTLPVYQPAANDLSRVNRKEPNEKLP
jgi:phospholipid/cholesterol/gamma-HCH transport system substrate-binding protein